MKKREPKYQINKTRSIIALIISIAIMTILAINIVHEVVRLKDSAYSVFQYFTTISNIFAAYAAILTVPYALEGIFSHRYNVSSQINKLLFCGTVCVTITMILALGVLWPVNGDDAVTGYNFWCHIICPILVITLFSIVSNEKPIQLGDCFYAVIPFFIYQIIYVTMVVIIGEEHGGWNDFYYILDMMPAWLAIILSSGAVFMIAMGFRFLHNMRATVRRKKMVQSIIEHYQPEDGTDLRFMLYEMGEIMGGYDGQFEMMIPIQLFEILAEHYTDFQLDDMVKIYVKGAMNHITHEQ